MLSAVFLKGNAQPIFTCLESTIETPEQSVKFVYCSLFIVNFEEISHIALVFVLLTSNKELTTG